MIKWALDASAVLALVNGEPGAELVRNALADGAVVSTVNLSETIAKLTENGMPEVLIHEALIPFQPSTVDFDLESAYAAGLLRNATRAAGLSLGGRACLALAARLSVPALTTDRAWLSFQPALAVRAIR